MKRKLTSRYQKVRKGSDGYKKGLRYIDYGGIGRKTRFLKHRPRGLK